jgi:hypothetical protein
MTHIIGAGQVKTGRSISFGSAPTWSIEEGARLPEKNG